MKGHLFLLFYLILLPSIAQNTLEESGIIDNYSANDAMNETNTEAAENLSVLIKNPFDINNLHEGILLSLGFLNEIQINEILTYSSRYSPIINIHELQILPSINETTFNLLKLCFVCNENQQANNLLKNLYGKEQSMLLIRYGAAQAEISDAWLGSGERVSIRFQTCIPNKMRMGMCVEKDAGEYIQWNYQKRYYGFDNINFYVHYLPSKKWKQLTIGTQRLQFGQGLLMGAGFSAGKGSETITTLRKSGRSIIPVGSSTEYGRLFGISSTYQLTKHISCTGFYSRTNEDARIDTSSYTSTIQSISETGYHRTESELAKRKTVQTSLMGYHFRYEQKRFSAGQTFIYRETSNDVQPTSTYYNQFYNRGKTFTGASIDVQWQVHNILFFAEWAASKSKGSALLMGMMIALHRKVDLSILYRNYGRTYISPYAQAFGESSSISNERGYYVGLKIRPKKEWSIHAYADVFVFPWLKYRVHKPSTGEECFIRIEYKPTKKTSMYIQHRYEQKSWDVSGTNLTLPATRQTTILYFEHKVSMRITLRTRLQWGEYTTNNIQQKGSLFAQDIIYKQRKYQVTFRWMWYDVEDYNARQYAYEPDVPYSFYIPAYNGKAVRPMIIVKYNLFNNIDMWFKIAFTKPMQDVTIETAKALYSGTWQLRWVF